jgi:AcrR family transcriptional regulator
VDLDEDEATGVTRQTSKRSDAKPAHERPNQARRKEVLDVAARLFSEKGFRGTSMDDIANELGILKGSLYYWIDSKEALLTEILIGSTMNTIREAESLARQDVPSATRLRLLIRSHIQSWIDNPHNFSVFLAEHRWLDAEKAKLAEDERGMLEGFYKQVLREGIERGEFKLDERDVTIAVNGIFGLMNWFPRWYRPGGWASSEHISDVFADMVINGLKT